MVAENGVLDTGSVALVSGASRGIGRVISHALARRGVQVIAVGRDLERLSEMRDALPASEAARVHPVVLDVADAGAVARFCDDLPEALRDIDILINNAGHDVGGRRAFHEGEADEWDAIIETNVKGLMRLTRAVIAGMLTRQRGHIVNMGSVAGLSTYAGGTAYNASKYAVRAFSDALRKDYAQTALRVTEILPGLVKTDFALNRLKQDNTGAENFYGSFNSYLDPGDIANAVFYALEQSADVNISQIVIEPTRTGRKADA